MSCSATSPRISIAPSRARRNNGGEAGRGDLADFGRARQHDAIARRDDRHALPARARLGELGFGGLGLGLRSERGGAATLELLHREGIARSFGARIFRLRGGGGGLELLVRGLGAVHLGFGRERIESRQHLPALHAIARLDQHLRDAPAVAFDADRHVVLGADQPGQGDGGGDIAERGHHDGDQRGHGAVFVFGLGGGRRAHASCASHRRPAPVRRQSPMPTSIRREGLRPLEPDPNPIIKRSTCTRQARPRPSLVD